VDEPKFDLALNAELQNGLVLLSHRRNARGILVQPFNAATVCEFEPAPETDRVMQLWLRPWIPKKAEEFAICP
jgi:hypothetical protein